tara:strand:+ start:688 stop:840 length:153 start_codon:yes stop_codon:yes gene_type:complete
VEIYNPEEFRRPTAIWSQFEVVNNYIKTLELRIKELENLTDKISKHLPSS